MHDIIIIGQGIAGSLAALNALNRKLKIIIIDNNKENASQIAAGLIEPISGKRFTLSWDQALFLPFAKQCYEQLETIFNMPFILSTKTHRYFVDQTQKDIVDKRLSDPKFKSYFGKKQQRPHQTLFKYGGIEINHSFAINTSLLLSTIKKHLKEKNILITDTFTPKNLQILPTHISYKDHQAKTILFCQGAQLEQNPLFSHLPFRSSKGDILTLKLPQFNPNCNLSFNQWLIPTKETLFKYGATYEWPPYQNLPLESSKQTLLNHFTTFIKTPYKLLNHQSGIRCALTNNKPICEKHPKYDRVYVCSALGSKGFMQAPYLTQQIINTIHGQTCS